MSTILAQWRVHREMAVCALFMCGAMLWAGSGRSWAEEPPQSPGDGPASEMTQELGVAGQSETGEVGSRALKPLSPAVTQQKIQRPMPPKTWDVLWAITWKRANSYFQIQAAPTTLQDPMCANALMLDVLVHDTILAIANKKYGDAARFMSQFQDRSLCLTREGVRGVEFALSFYLHHALAHLPPPQAHIAVQGVLNLGMLTFDQVQYTRRSWWLLTVMSHATMIGPHMGDYPRNDLGLWLYDSRRGIMLRNRLPDGLDRLIGAMRRVESFGGGTCALIDMSEEGFVCQDDYAGTGMTQAGTSGAGGRLGKFPVMPGSLPPNTAACMLQSVQATGVRGTIACMSKAMAGFTFNPRTGLQDKTIPDSQQAGLRDKMCAIGQDAGGQGTDGETANEQQTKAKEPSTWEKFKQGVSDVAGKAWGVVTAIFEKTPPVVSELEQAASPEGADAARGFLQMNQELKARDSLLKDEGYQDYEKQRDQRVVTDPQASKGRLAGDSSGAPDGGKCSARSNAAARAKALYQCTAGQTKPDLNSPPGTGPLPSGGQQASSGDKGVGGQNFITTDTTGTKKGGSTTFEKGGLPRPLDPSLIHVDPSADPTPGMGPGGSLPGPLSCMVEAGDLIRTSLNDPRCDTRMRCVDNQPCPCNRQGGGLVGGQPQDIRPAQATPDCIDGRCGDVGVTGTPNPPPKPGFNFGGPVPPLPLR